MSDAHDLVRSMKRAPLDAMESGKPVDVSIETVSKAEPLEIAISEKITLCKEQLLITDTASKISFEIGDKVVLIRLQGGQQFMILDKAGELT